MFNLKRQITRRGNIAILAIAVVMILSACAGQAQQPTAIPMADIQTPSSENTPLPTADVTATATVAPIPTETVGAAAVSFAKDVLPILESRCVKCHGGEKTEKGLNMTSYEHLIAGSEKGPVLVAGDAANSKLIQLVEQGKMPKRAPKLPPDQLQILINWVAAGAVNN